MSSFRNISGQSDSTLLLSHSVNISSLLFYWFVKGSVGARKSPNQQTAHVYKPQTQYFVSEMSGVPSEKKVVEVGVECFRPYSHNVWSSVGPGSEGVERSPALSPPHHLTYYVRLAPDTSKGLSMTDLNTLVFLVLEGELTVIITDEKFTARKGDTFYVPMNNKYDLLNQTQQKVELFVFQYKYITNKGSGEQPS